MTKKYINYKILNVVIVFLLFCLVFLNQYNNTKKRKEAVEKYDGTGIAYIKETIYEDSHVYIRFYFYHNGKIIFSKQSERDENQTNILNNYFLVTFDTKNPKNNYIHLNKRVQPDSLSLVNAGFKYKKYYIHDITTNTHVEKYKWQ
ncbi:hypothetical protein [Flavobacterium sp. J27]|uniref:hypothetical protein n=1 Tax=Flavobacterium sp. J27 TaxID=2060419 RepID=UPI00103057C2|nr:hypothetical protein [Flavobacterium sp. J27]